MRKWSFFFLPFLLFQTNSLTAQSNDRPVRVGVVFSGGGAKGYAHIGVLKVIEDAGIRIDYIGGASSGAIVGGLYASGWKANQLDSLLHVQNMGALIQEHTDRSYLPFYEKQFGEKYSLSLTFKDYKPTLPQALSNGQQLYDFFSALTAHVAEEHDFSQLPIPFLCTGTDVVTGQPLVFEKGSLPLAIRASGSFPGLLAPIEIDGHLVADGGILNNFPAECIHEKGVDIIIGINIESGLLQKDQLNSMERILSQIGSFQMDASTRAQSSICDLVIHPDVRGFSITSFNDVDTLINNGEAAARAVWPQLLEIAARQKAAPAPPERPMPHLPQNVEIQVGKVDLQSTTAMSNKTLMEKLPKNLPGKMAYADFQEGINRLYATGYYQFIEYSFQKDSSGLAHLKIQPRIKEAYENQLRVGLHYDKVYKSSLLLNATFRNKIFFNSIASFDLIIGDKFRYDFHYLVDNSRMPDVGFNSRLNFTNLNVQLPVEIDVQGEYIVEYLRFTIRDFNNELYVNFFSGKNFETGISAEIKYFQTFTAQAVNYLTDDPYIDEEGAFGSAKLYYHSDNRDRPVLAHSGARWGVEARLAYPFSSQKYQGKEKQPGLNLDVRWLKAFPLNQNLTLNLSLDAGLTLGTPAVPYRYFLGSTNQNLINNFRPFPGLPFGHAAGDHLISSGLQLQYKLAKVHYLVGGVNMAWVDSQPIPLNDRSHQFKSANIGYIVDTALGPIEFRYAFASKDYSEFYVNIGYWF